MNKRQHQRVPFSGKAKLVAEKAEVDVTISNLSLGGLLFHTSSDFDLGKEVIIHISGTFRRKTFNERVIGRIVASHRGPVGNSFGIRFLSYLNPEREPTLHSWVESHQDNPSPSFLRNSRE
ncbi:MAG: PilZ domain-containing protein [Nitrospiria bacterium]